MADDRTYIRLHDGMPGHPKVLGLSDKAFRAYVTALCHCSQYLTDGSVKPAVARTIAPPKVWAELVDAGLVEIAPEGYEMHDYLEHQRSAEEVAEIKAGRGAGGTLGNHVRWHLKRRVRDPKCEHCNPKDGIANGSQERSDSDSDGTSQTDRSRSHSQRQRQPSSGYESEGGYVPNASDTPPPFPDHCIDHAYDEVPPKCGGCQKQKAANRRRAAERAPLTVVRETKRCVVHDINYREFCNGCRADEIGRRDEESA